MNLRFVHIVTFCLLSATLPRMAYASPPAGPNLRELQQKWKIVAADKIAGDQTLVSHAAFDGSQWYEVKRMPATVLQTLEDAGVYKSLYYSRLA